MHGAPTLDLDSMRIISVSSKVGQQRGARAQALALCADLVDQDNPVQLDFTGVHVISYTFAKELSAHLRSIYGEDRVRAQVVFRNLKPGVRRMIETAFEQDFCR
jgi:hypothetical protein